MQIEHRVIARCCNLRQEHQNEQAALDTLLSHIHYEHKELYLILEERAKRFFKERSEYFVKEWGIKSDWQEAPLQFKQSLIRSELEGHLSRRYNGLENSKV